VIIGKTSVKQLSGVDDKTRFGRRVRHRHVVVRLIIREWNAFELLQSLGAFDVLRTRIDAQGEDNTYGG
jgi:hypothetical protein